METKKIKISRFRSVKFCGDYDNCKFSTIDGIQLCLKDNKKKTLKAIKELTKDERTWFVTVNDTKYIDMLKEEFELIYVQKVPLGYYDGFQYHCLFEGGLIFEYKDRIRKYNKTQPNQLLTDKHLNKILNYKSKTWLKKYLSKFI